MFASTGAPLSGQDALLYVRAAGGSTWTTVGAPDATGTANAELFAGAYDFEARWFAAMSVQTNVAITPSATVTFHTTSAACRIVASTGTGLSGADGACFFRLAGTQIWTLSGYPDETGTVVQEVFPASYDFEARWFGQTSVQSAVAVTAGAPPTMSFQTTSAVLQLIASTGVGLTGADGAFFVRVSGTSPWMMAGAPDATGTLAQELFPGTYDIEARWFAATSVQSSVAVVANAPPTVAFHTKLATLRMLSSTGPGLAGQDESMWVRPTGTSVWNQSDLPSAGVVTQELLPGTYDVRSRWINVYAQQSSIAVNGPVTVTFTSVPFTLRMLTSSGAGLSGQDEAVWVRQTGTTNWFFLGPPASGVLVQEVYAATYDAKFRWTGTSVTLGSNAVSGPATVTINAVAVVETCRKQSDGTLVVGATGSVVNGATTYPFGTTNGSGVVNMQVFVGAHDFRCKLGSLQGTNTNVNIPAGGGATTVNMS
jgi:hypothetical protein